MDFMDLYGMCPLTGGSNAHFVHSLAHGLLQCGGGPKIIRKSMLKRGAQKGGPKGENKWLDVHLEWAGAVRTLFATFHENSKYHRKCL